MLPVLDDPRRQSAEHAMRSGHVLPDYRRGLRRRVPGEHHDRPPGRAGLVDDVEVDDAAIVVDDAVVAVVVVGDDPDAASDDPAPAGVVDLLVQDLVIVGSVPPPGVECRHRRPPRRRRRRRRGGSRGMWCAEEGDDHEYKTRHCEVGGCRAMIHCVVSIFLSDGEGRRACSRLRQSTPLPTDALQFFFCPRPTPTKVTNTPYLYRGVGHSAFVLPGCLAK